jgi:hypothetical protein
LSQDGVDALFWYDFDPYNALQGNISFIKPPGSGATPKPAIGARYLLWPSGFDNVTSLVHKLLAAPRDPSSADGYSLICVHAWDSSYADAAAVVGNVTAALGPQGGVDFVTPGEFVARINSNVKPGAGSES